MTNNININYVRRPWVNYWDKLPYDSKNLDQQMKLIRNQVASMDLGLPGFNLYDRLHHRNGTPRDPLPTGRESYLEWVKDWKQTYAALSECIRRTRVQRSPKGFTEAMRVGGAETNLSFESNLSRMRSTLEALRIAAQIMLNARAIGKLASAQLRQRAYEAKQ